MKVLRLGHVNLRTPLVEETVGFYATALGLEVQPGPAMTAEVQNYWLTDARGDALVHIIGLRPGETERPEGPSRLDHFALDCEGLESCIARLGEAGIPFDRVEVASRGLIQLNIYDPNGIKVELTFSEAA